MPQTQDVAVKVDLFNNAVRLRLGFLSCPSSSSFRLLGGSRLEVSLMDIQTQLKVKLLLSPRHSRGITYWIYEQSIGEEISLGYTVAKRVLQLS
jgi:DUF971 family protein